MKECGRIGSVSASLILAFLGLVLTITAILMPSWQVVNLREYNSIHEHGLWFDCTRHWKDGERSLHQRNATITEPLHCVYKFDYANYSRTFNNKDHNAPVGEGSRHKFYGWHKATLIILFLAILTTFLSGCLGTISAFCYRNMAPVFTGFTLLTTILCFVAVVLFYIFSHTEDNRFIKGIVGTYEQRVGLAFYIQLVACFFYFFSFLLAMLFINLSSEVRLFHTQKFHEQ